MTATAFDPTPADHALELERRACNAAFYDLGLPWYWDGDTFASLQEFPDSRARVRRYIETHHPHLLHAYDPDFLAQAIERAKAEHLHGVSGAASDGLRLTIDRPVSCAAERGA